MTKLPRIAVILILTLSGIAQETPATAIAPQQVDDVVNHLEDNLKAYVFPRVSEELRKQISAHRSDYRTISDPNALAARLTADLRSVGHDQHLQVVFGLELGLQKEPTPEEKQHAHAFDRGNAYGIRSYRRLPGNIGYINLAYFSPDADAGSAIAAVMQMVNGADALIIDLRHNGGGSGDSALTLLSYFFEEPTQLSSMEEREGDQIHEHQQWTTPYVAGPRFLGKPIFALTSSHTHSAAEFVAYDLKNTHRATIVGERTGGHAHSATGEIRLGYGFSALIPNAQPKSPITHTNWEGVGVEPDVVTDPSDALLSAYKSALKDAKPGVESEMLSKERASAIQDPGGALNDGIQSSTKK
jgi:hypothetical protein